MTPLHGFGDAFPTDTGPKRCGRRSACEGCARGSGFVGCSEVSGFAGSGLLRFSGSRVLRFVRVSPRDSSRTANPEPENLRT